MRHFLERQTNPTSTASCWTIDKVAQHRLICASSPVLYTQVKQLTTPMRKIEQLMNVAISNNHEYWSKANTSVETIDGVSYVRLHGNLIAEVDDDGIKLYDGGWQSNTTKSRINAILTEHGIAGEGVFQKNYQWFIRLYNGTEFFVTEFRSGMRLGPLANSDLMA